MIVNLDLEDLALFLFQSHEDDGILESINLSSRQRTFYKIEKIYSTKKRLRKNFLKIFLIPEYIYNKD